MNRNIVVACFLLTITLFSRQVCAQETFINTVNTAYLDKLIATAKKNYPEVKIRQSQVRAAHSNYNATKFAWLDGLTASYIYSPQNLVNQAQPTIFKGYQLAITLSIGQLLKNPSVTSAANETYKIAQYQQAEYMLTLEAQVRKFYYAYLQAMAELRLRSGAVSDAGAAVKQLKYAFQKGETTFQIYNEQLNSYYNQNSFMLQAELATWTAKTNLEELLGIKLEDIK
ncbi:TolC family protein [Mucilaginibacter ginsenosidivorax]|uniref:TolC family protein n=1 Tax=Mucilaginibacter ginsenosidivorax TaxID=862126 RepID=A0A5B8VUQ8_9SPHI|nr:TolC family protein [Mucilaginibacter ginsenosidivorax]QEC74506.1 TolC family protein [Mucilaginibacter ginsenosidivorax]